MVLLLQLVVDGFDVFELKAQPIAVTHHPGAFLVGHYDLSSVESSLGFLAIGEMNV
ncbi:hypothetical protein D3C79_1065210 [compost metagenome]